MVRYQVRIEGFVQGVGMRYFLCYTAKNLGLTGWVCNREDGSVELQVQGEETAVDSFLALARRGNAYAQVDHFQLQKCPLEDEYHFEVVG